MNLETLQTDLGVDYRATFVPLSQSRNAKEKHRTLNWRIRITKGSLSLECDYSAGVAHIPGYKFVSRKTVRDDDLERAACETGKAFGHPIPAPRLADVMHSLVMDADVIEHPSLESWARECGMDADSRRAERIYRECLENALTLRVMLGDETLRELRTLFRDY